MLKFKDISNKEKPNFLKKKFSLNEKVFEKFVAGHRDHQTKSIEAIHNSFIGQILLPTGTGKTRIQQHAIIEDMIDKTKNNQPGVYVIAAHRLVLCTQLFNEVIDLSVQTGLKTDILYLGSGNYDFSGLKNKYKNTGLIVAGINTERTTNSKEILEFVKNAQKKNHHVLIVSTYHSFHRLTKLECIDLATFDEAHTTVSDQFTNNINPVKKIIKRQYFFTATKRVIGENGGQADTKFYGKVLYSMSPKEAVDKGEIIKPFIHYMYIKDEFDEEGPIDENLAIKTVKEAFLRHDSKRKENFKHSEKIGSKILVTTNGLKELHSICDNKEFQQWCKSSKIRTFSFSSDNGQSIDFLNTSKQKTLEAMNNLKDDENAILFHYDILTEGIDLPTITAVLLLRDLPLTKLLQNIGRGVRLFKEDRTKIYSKEILPTNYKEMIKPYCHVILPIYTNNNYNRTREIICELRDTYKIPFEHIENEDKAIADPENSISVVTEQDKQQSKIPPKLKHIFEDIFLAEREKEFQKIKNKMFSITETLERLK